MKKVLWIVGGLIGLLIVVALAAPFFIDLNNYKAEIAAAAKKATGRDLAIDGDISLSILPTPGVTVSGIRFGNAPGGSQPDMATLESAKVKVALMPMISGKVEVEEVVLDKPTFIFEKLKDGSGNWQIAPEAEAPEAGVTPAPSAAPSSGGGMAVVIKSASIEGGTLIYRDLAAGTEQKVENLNIDLSLDSLTGPFQAEGGATVANIPVGFRIKTGALDQKGPMPLDVSFSLTDAKATIGFVGQVDIAAVEDPSKPIVTGKLSSKGDNLAKLITGMPGQSAVELPPLMSQAFAVDGDIEAGKTHAKTDNFTANIGDLTAKVSVAADYAAAPNVQANVAVGRIDLDQLLPAGAAKTESAEASTQAAPAKPAEPFALPPDVTAGVDVAVEQIVYKGQAIDDTKLSAQLANGQFTLKNASAKLPGGSSVNANGVVTAVNGQPNFNGALKADSSNLRALIEAFAPGAVKDVPGDRLRKLALNTGVKYTPAQAELVNLKATLDQSTLSGGAVVALPDGVQRKQMGLGVGLAVDKLNLDGYMPSPSAKAAEPAATETKKEQGGNPLKALAPLADYNANVDFKAGSLTLNDQQINGLRLVAQVANGTLDVKELSVADFQGGKANVAAKVTDLKGDPKFDSKFDVTAKDAGRVLQMAGMGAQPKGKFGALTLKGTAAGTPTDVTFDVTTAMAGIGFQGAAKGTANGIGQGIPKINSTFDIKAKDLGPLADLAGAPADAAKNMGAVSFTGQAQSGADDLAYDVVLAMSGIGGKGTLKGKVAGISGTPQIDTALNLTADKPAPLLQLAGIAGPKAKSVGALGIAGTLKGGAENMALDLNLDGIGGKAKVAGTVQMPKAKDPNNPPPIGFDIALSADHPEFTQLLQVADIPSSGVKAGPLKVSLKAAGNTKNATVSDLNAAWGNSSIAGNASYDATGAKPMIVANLKGGVVNLTPFMGGESSKSGGGASSGGGGGKGGSPWSEEPLDLSALRSQDADIDLTAKSLIMPGQQIDDLVAKITLRNGLMTMQTLNGKIYGGGFDLSGTTVDGSGSAAKVDAKVAVKQIQVGQVLGGGIAGNQVKGPLSLNLNAAGAGESQAALMRSLAGNGNVDGTIMIIGKMEQQVGSALLGVLGAKVKAVQGVTSAVNGILSSYTGVDNKLDGTFNIKQGVLDTQDFAFVNPKARGTAKGQVDIGAWAMNMLIDLFSADQQQAFMSIGLTGPVDGPTPKFASNGAAGPAGLMGLSSNGAFNPSGLVQEIPGLGKLPGIGNLLGGGQGAPATGTEGQPGAAIPGVGNVPGVKLPGGVQDLLGGNKTKQSPDQQQPGGILPGVEDLFGNKKKKQQQQQQIEPGAAEPGAALPGEAPAEQAPAAEVPTEQAPAEQAPAEQQTQPEQQQAEPGATEPGAAPPGEQQPSGEQQPGIILPGVQIPGTGN